MDGLFVAPEFDTMLIGLIAASFATFWLGTVNNVLKAASAVLFSGMLAGPGAPVLAAYLIARFPIIADASDPLRWLLAVIIGGSVTWFLPIFIDYVRNKMGGTHA